MYNPRSKQMINIRALAAESNNIEELVQGGVAISATESLDDPKVSKRASSMLKQYIVAQTLMTIGDAPAFFSQDVEQAYDELVGLLNDPEIRARVIEFLKPYLADRPEEFGGLPNADEEARLYHRYNRAFKRVEGLQLEAAEAEKSLELAKLALTEKYPDYLDEE